MKSGVYQYDLVEVIWDDAECSEGWDKAPDELEEKLAVTVGFRIRETKKHLLICHTIDAADQTNGRLQIPKGMVRKVTLLAKSSKSNTAKIT